MSEHLRETADSAHYMMGHSEHELRRLVFQASILGRATERLLRESGLAPGMRVLDIGCGVGDVAMLAAEMVGPSGAVVGIDRSEKALATARARATALSHVKFVEASAESYAAPEPFDLAVGRLVLIHQADPAAMIRWAAGQVRPGGVIAFNEFNLHEWSFKSRPEIPLWRQYGDWLLTAFKQGSPQTDAGGRLIEHFANAGLPQPQIFSETVVGGGADSPMIAWFAQTFETVFPVLLKLGVTTEKEVGLATLEDRLRESVVASPHSQLVGPPQYCAWVRV